MTLERLKVATSLIWRHYFAINQMYPGCSSSHRGCSTGTGPGIRTPISPNGERLTVQFRNVKVVDLNHDALKSYLQSRGIDQAIGECECKEVHYTCHKKNISLLLFPIMAVVAGSVIPISKDVLHQRIYPSSKNQRD